MSNSLWNSSSFRLYGNDLWSTLLLKNKLTRTTRFLLLLNRRRHKKLRRKAFFHWHKRLNKVQSRRRELRILKRQVFRTLYRVRRLVTRRFYKNRILRKKLFPLYRHFLSLGNDIILRRKAASSATLSFNNKDLKLRRTKLLKFKRNFVKTHYRPSSRSVRFLNFLNRYRSPPRKPRMRFRKYLVDYLRRNDFDRLREPRLRRRHFLSRLVLNFRKFRNFYANLTSRQFRNLVRISKASGSKTTFSMLLKNLETRVDTVLFRSGLVSSFFMARQLINHKHVFLNGKNVIAPSASLNWFDIVSLYNVDAKNDVIRDIISHIAVVFQTRLTRPVMYFQFKKVKVPREFSERDSRKLKSLLYRRSVIELKGTNKQFPLEVTKSSLIHLQHPSHLETNYLGFATSLIAEVFFKKLFYPFKIKRPAIEMFLYSRRGF
jgi:ribosomal protein S4